MLEMCTTAKSRPYVRHLKLVALQLVPLKRLLSTYNNHLSVPIQASFRSLFFLKNARFVSFSFASYRVFTQMIFAHQIQSHWCLLSETHLKMDFVSRNSVSHSRVTSLKTFFSLYLA